MKELKSMLTLLVMALVAGTVLAAVMAGRAAVREVYAYRTMVAPRTLHQMVLEAEAAETDDSRSTTLLYGAGLASMAVLIFAGFIFSMRGGTELLRQWRLGRRRVRHRPQTDSPQARLAPPAPLAPILTDGGESNENYANSIHHH